MSHQITSVSPFERFVSAEAENLFGGDEYVGHEVFLVPNTLPISATLSLIGHPLGPTHWEGWNEDRAGDQSHAGTPGASDAFTDTEAILSDLAKEIDDYITVVAPPGDMTPQSVSTWQGMTLGRIPSPDALTDLGKELTLRRPVLPVRENDIERPDARAAEFYALWPPFVQAALPLLDSIAVIGNVYNVGGADMIAPQGTAWLVAPNVVATNAHVVNALRRHGWTPGNCNLDGRVEVHFAVRQHSKGPTMPCLEVLREDPVADIALISVGESAGLVPKPIELQDCGDELEGRKVVVVGYPLPDQKRNPLLGDLLLTSSGGFQSASPGVIVSVGEGEFRHNCSTLGGNSGSPVLDMETATVLGIHREGNYFLGLNIAARAQALHGLLRE